MAIVTADIRNVALVGQTGAGKTSLAEALLFAAKAIPTKGSVAKGSTVCDYDPQAKRLLHTLDPSVCGFETQGKLLTLVDTPGFMDFLGRSLAVLAAVETVAAVVSAKTGVGPVTQRAMDFAKDRGLAQLVIINKIDAQGANAEQVLADVRERFGKHCLPLNLPAQGGKAVIDVFSATSGAADFSSAEAAHLAIVDQVVEVDEKLMQDYLDQGDVKPAQLHDAFERALREGHLVPVCFVSAETGAGIAALLDVFVRLMPNPAEGNPPGFLAGEGDGATSADVAPDPHKHVVAHVFKITSDPFVGKLALFRIYQGTIKPGQQLFVDDSKRPIKLAHVFHVKGKELIEATAGIPGDICAATKVEELHFGAILHDSHEQDGYRLKAVTFPPAMLGRAIEAAKRGDEQRLADALHKIVAEDPCVRVEHRPHPAETVIYGMGELHLRVLLERMKERFNVQFTTRAPAIAYRETITKKADARHRHKKQTGGAGQFGEVALRVEPLPRGTGFEFVDDVVGGVIPGQYIPAVEKGVRQALAEGAVAGFPIHDLRVTVYDGKYHAVDSKEVAFVTAGRKAFITAVQQAGATILEPIVRVEIAVPATSIGDVTADLMSRRGRVTGNTSLPGGRVAVTALVPLAEIGEYQAHLESMTAGDGTYTLDVSHYDPVPPRKQQELAAAWKPHEAED